MDSSQFCIHMGGLCTLLVFIIASFILWCINQTLPNPFITCTGQVINTNVYHSSLKNQHGWYVSNTMQFNTTEPKECHLHEHFHFKSHFFKNENDAIMYSHNITNTFRTVIFQTELKQTINDSLCVCILITFLVVLFILSSSRRDIMYSIYRQTPLLSQH